MILTISFKHISNHQYQMIAARLGVIFSLFIIFLLSISQHTYAVDINELEEKISKQEIQAVETLLQTLESLKQQGIDQETLTPLLENQIQSARQELSSIEEQIKELKRTLHQLEVIQEWAEDTSPDVVPKSNSANVQFDLSTDFKKERVFTVLQKHCNACHANGASKGSLSLDFDSEEQMLQSHDKWWAVLKNMRSGVMPPKGIPRPTQEDIEYVAGWIKQDVFAIDPEHPNPSAVTLHRLNRIEYAETIDDLMGVKYNTFAEFPPDDTGFGFDNIGEVLTVSPMLLEKYLTAAKSIVEQAVPAVTKVMPVKRIHGRNFRSVDGKGNGGNISFYKEDEVAYTFKANENGQYRIELNVEIDGEFDFDPGRVLVKFFINGEERFSQEMKWHSNKEFFFEYIENWEKGEHILAFTTTPLVSEDDRKNNIDFEINDIRIEGPLDESKWVHPDNYKRFFTRDEPPEDENERFEYAKELLTDFTAKAYRRPANQNTVEKLTAIAQHVYNQPGKTFEAGVAQAMIAVLASPRFLYRVEETLPLSNSERFPMIDEYSLASRLSYFFWSTMPDDELTALANQGELRNQLHEQVQRLMTDERAQEALVSNFTGQWLQARDVEVIPINVRSALDLPRRRRGQERLEFTPELRQAMRAETESLFAHIMREDRSVLDLIDSNYTFLNAVLAKHYEIEGVEGSDMQKVMLPEDSPFGGVLTQGTVLTVTSNPTRTSPVKRGLYILDNILGTPAPPAPPDVPELEESEKEFKDRRPTLREVLEIHRQQPLCNSCHARFDPLGLAFENFTAFGTWRDDEHGEAINASGELITGESFNNVKELKAVLKKNKKDDFYSCLTEKMLIYALGRGLDYRDVETVDQIVSRMHDSGGKFSSLLMAIIESAPFQRRVNVLPKHHP